MATSPAAGSWVIGLGLTVLLAGYLALVVAGARRGRPWPWWRTASWGAGLAAAAAGALGPVARAAHHDFTAHMAGHLLVGMLAPLLLVLAAPVTALLRALPAGRARMVSRVLHHPVVRVLTHPVTALLLNAGGLWLLYTTGLYDLAGRQDAVHTLVHVHVLVSGYLLTAALVGVDPAPGRPGFGVRATVLVVFLAAHGILAKYLYGHPPAGVAAGQAESAAALMYYGGDLLDLAVIVLLCRQWYAATRPRPDGPDRAGQARAREAVSDRVRTADRTAGAAHTSSSDVASATVDRAR